jgi:PhnB protein
VATLNPYLNFKDNAKDAFEFYESVFGGNLTTSNFGDFGMSTDPEEATKIMHAQLITSSGFTLMGADTPNHMEYKPGTNFSVSLSSGPEGEEELTGYYNKLVEGGTAVEPLSKAPWGDSFGMLIDKFGTSWLVNIGGGSM